MEDWEKTDRGLEKAINGTTIIYARGSQYCEIHENGRVYDCMGMYDDLIKEDIIKED